VGGLEELVGPIGAGLIAAGAIQATGYCTTWLSHHFGDNLDYRRIMNVQGALFGALMTYVSYETGIGAHNADLQALGTIAVCNTYSAAIGAIVGYVIGALYQRSFTSRAVHHYTLLGAVTGAVTSSIVFTS
jgi:hypothetical protein